MELYELYAEKKNADTGQSNGYKRVGLFCDKNNALEYKDKWEKKWQYNNKNCISKDPDPWMTGSKLILKTVKTND